MYVQNLSENESFRDLNREGVFLKKSSDLGRVRKIGFFLSHIRRNCIPKEVESVLRQDMKDCSLNLIFAIPCVEVKLYDT